MHLNRPGPRERHAPGAADRWAAARAALAKRREGDVDKEADGRTTPGRLRARPFALVPVAGLATAHIFLSLEQIVAMSKVSTGVSARVSERPAYTRTSAG